MLNIAVVFASTDWKVWIRMIIGIARGNTCIISLAPNCYYKPVIWQASAANTCKRFPISTCTIAFGCSVARELIRVVFGELIIDFNKI